MSDLRKKIDGLSQEQLAQVDTYIDGLLTDDEAGEKALKAEKGAVHSKVMTPLVSSYRGKA